MGEAVTMSTKKMSEREKIKTLESGKIIRRIHNTFPTLYQDFKKR